MRENLGLVRFEEDLPKQRRRAEWVEDFASPSQRRQAHQNQDRLHDSLMRKLSIE